ncbi:hypothetical protein FHG87_019806 [Trinorchestia longiramus]|nr:hypothetical protein FHG87_019806 [Trinorchestia longiramus]
MGVGVTQTKNEVLLEQSAYTKALLSRIGMDKANSVATPVDINADLVTTSDEVEDCDKDLYQSAVDTWRSCSRLSSQLSSSHSFQFSSQLSLFSVLSSHRSVLSAHCSHLIEALASLFSLLSRLIVA